MNKQIFGYRFSRSKSDTSFSEYCHTHCEVYHGILLDAAKEYSNSPTSYNLERLQKIRESGESSIYMSGDYRDSVISLGWQADPGNWERDNPWYALQIDQAELSKYLPKVINLLLKHEINECSQPSQVLDVFIEAGYRAVKHDRDTPYGAWILRDHNDPDEFDISPWPERTDLCATNATLS